MRFWLIFLTTIIITWCCLLLPRCQTSLQRLLRCLTRFLWSVVLFPRCKSIRYRFLCRFFHSHIKFSLVQPFGIDRNFIHCVVICSFCRLLSARPARWPHRWQGVCYLLWWGHDVFEGRGGGGCRYCGGRRWGRSRWLACNGQLTIDCWLLGQICVFTVTCWN